MKRKISVIIAIILLMICLNSCGKQGVAGKKYSLYLGISQEHEAGDGKAKFASTYVAVICDKKGKIVDCVFDGFESTTSLEGGVADYDENVQSKNELGLEYSMKSASPIGREWYEQAAHFADFIKGKALDEVEEVDGGEAELMAGCTININGFKEAIDNAEEIGGIEVESGSEPSAKVAFFADYSDTKNASAETDGVAHLSVTYTAVAMSEGKIAAAALDQTETKVYFDDSGLIINLDKGESKREAGYDYGMKPASAIGLEWFEQADNFARAIVGMSPSDVAGMRLNGEYLEDETLLAGCSIKVTDFVKAVAKTGK